MTWIDALAILTLGIAFYCGWRVGLIGEFFDAGSLVGATLLAGLWSGGIAAGLPPTWPLSEAARHLMAFWLLFLFIFAIIRCIGWLIAYRSDWPASTWLNGVGGGLIGAVKALAALFVVLYVALFVPMDAQVRDTLRQSPIAVQLDRFFPPLNDAVVSIAPKYYKLVVRPIMRGHRL